MRPIIASHSKETVRHINAIRWFEEFLPVPRGGGIFLILILRLSSHVSHLRFIMDKVNLADKFSHISEYWKPYIAGELNGQLVKLDKLKGEFVWHHHDNEDELFLVVKGQFRIEFRDKTVWLQEGEFIIVPRGVEHRPVADEECWILLFEPASTLNTGNVENNMTLRELERI